MGTRKLGLTSERLVELSTTELEAVAGGSFVPSVDVCVQIDWPTQDCTGYYPSINAPCTE